MKTSKFLSLNLSDFLKGFLMAVLTPVMVIIQQSIDAGVLTFNWKAIAMAAIGGGLAYLIKNFFTKEKLDTEIQSIGGTQIPPKKDEK